jgi:hypothetical protein
MEITKSAWAAVGTALLLAACGGGGGGNAGAVNNNPARGGLVQSPPTRTISLSAADFTAELSASPDGLGALKLSTGSFSTPLPCGVDIQYIKYGTVGGQGEATTATGALMVPNGIDPKCTGAHPILLYGHGTNITKRYNIADIIDTTNPGYKEAILLASLFAAQGYIVVAPNYAGYDSSTLPYHPYVNADQQSKDMIDALAAAKAALPTLLTPTVASSKLFVSGYSQGGFVAMATVRAMQQSTPPIPVTASAPMSGPYALAAYVDAVFLGRVPAGSTAFAPLLVNSYKNSYPNLSIYSNASDIYESAYVSGIDSLVPGNYDFTTVFSSGKLPLTNLFNNVLGPYAAYASISPPTGTGATDALFALGFGTSNLVKNSYRFNYVGDALVNGDNVLATTPTTYQPAATPGIDIRKALKTNDLRNFIPTSPTLLCGGSGDPTVFYGVNTQVVAGLWAANAVPNWKVLNLEPASSGYASTATGATAYQGLFAQAKSDFIAALPAGSDPTASVTANYHGTLVPPYCTRAAKDFFDPRV